MYWIERNSSRRFAPDVYVAFGVPKRPWRPAWKVWEMGKAPDVIFALTSRSTAPEDLGRKYRLHQRLGVKEYILMDVMREYRQIPNERPDDREWRAYNEQLG